MNSRAAALVAAVVALSSCEPPKSKHPLTELKSAVADPKLAGVWSGQVGKDGSKMTLSIFPREGALFDAVLVGDDGDKGAVVLTYEGFPSVVAGKKYWNLRAKTFEGDYAERSKVSDAFIFVRYEVGKDGSLSLWQMDDGPVEAAVKAGTLEGVIGEKAPVQLTASSEKLAAFVASPAGDKSFTPFATLKRAKLDYPKLPAK